MAIHIIQFTWAGDQEVERLRDLCGLAGMSYRAIRVWRRPLTLGALLTVVKGLRDIRRAIREWNIEVVMPRSTLPALSTLLALRGCKTPVVFDADGLPLDERVDFSGLSPSSLEYRLLRDVEAQAVRRADVILTRSSKAVDILLARAGAGTMADSFRIVSNGRDADVFSPGDEQLRLAVRARLGVGEDAPLVIYAGSLGGKYSLSAMFVLFDRLLARRPDSHFLILTGSPEAVGPELSRFPHISSSITTMTARPGDVPEYLAASDIGLALIKQSFSMKAAAAIKVGEYLLCGLPVIATPGVGDFRDMPDSVRLTMDDRRPDSVDQAVDWVVETVLPERELARTCCRRAGLEGYSLIASVDSYSEAFSTIAQ